VEVQCWEVTVKKYSNLLQLQTTKW